MVWLLADFEPPRPAAIQYSQPTLRKFNPTQATVTTPPDPVKDFIGVCSKWASESSEVLKEWNPPLLVGRYYCGQRHEVGECTSSIMVSARMPHSELIQIVVRARSYIGRPAVFLYRTPPEDFSHEQGVSSRVMDGFVCLAG